VTPESKLRLHWHQTNVTLASGPDAYPRFLGTGISDRLDEWLDCGAVRYCFFMHKRPGLRLRIAAADVVIRTELEEMMSRAQAEGAIDRFAVGLYEPETRLLGGPALIELAHEYFSADAMAVWSYFSASLRAPVAPAITFSIALIGRLVTALFDRFEAWDVWASAAELRGAGDVPGADVVDALRTAHSEEGSAEQLVNLGLPSLAASRFTRRLDGLVAAALHQVEIGAIEAGLRSVVPFWILFHWNRLGFDVETQRALGGGMAELMRPLSTGGRLTP
jgi:thiopeptide-type bacteriocin biosynthesis protein